MRMILYACLALAGLAASAHSCELTAGPGKVIRYSEGETGGFVTAACEAKKWEARIYWFGEQRIYDGELVIDAFPAVSASRVWRFRDGRRIRPEFSIGALVKGAQRCTFNGDIGCNRQLPLPYAFLFTAGVRFGDAVKLTLGHASNNSMDWGPEKKNLGLDHLWLSVVF